MKSVLRNTVVGIWVATAIVGISACGSDSDTTQPDPVETASPNVDSHSDEVRTVGDTGIPTDSNGSVQVADVARWVHETCGSEVPDTVDTSHATTIQEVIRIQRYHTQRQIDQENCMNDVVQPVFETIANNYKILSPEGSPMSIEEVIVWTRKGPGSTL